MGTRPERLPGHLIGAGEAQSIRGAPPIRANGSKRHSRTPDTAPRKKTAATEKTVSAIIIGIRVMAAVNQPPNPAAEQVFISVPERNIPQPPKKL